jgi:ribosomal protein L18
MKITDLPELLEPTDDDVLPIDDSPASNAATKKVTRGNLVKGLAKQTDLTAHTGNAALHRQINDAASTTDLWSASKIATELSTKAASSHTQSASTIPDFDTSVANNADVAANTVDRHTHANKALLDTYTQTEANLDDAVTKKYTHANQATLDATTASFTSGKDGKLSSIQDGATANDTDANLKNRVNHTGTQPASTISDFNTSADARISAQKGQNNGLASLDSGGKVPSAQLPALAITDTFVVASQAAMLALNAETGDVAVRTDLNKSFILKGSSAATLIDWQELLTPTDAVQSVNGKTGSVTLTTSDVAEGTGKYFTDVRVSVNTDVMASVTHGARTDNPHNVNKTQVGLANVPNMDATLRASHTGSQTAATISDFQTAVTANTILAA